MWSTSTSLEDIYKVYVALYDNGHRDLDWAIVIVTAADAKPVSSSRNDGTILAGGAYAVFDIQCLKNNHGSCSSSTTTTLFGDGDSCYAEHPLYEPITDPWVFRQRRVESPDADNNLVGMLQVAELKGTRAVSNFIIHVRNIPATPPTTAPISDAEYVFVDISPWNLFPYTTEVITAPVLEKRHEDWNDSAWVLEALEHLSCHRDIPDAARIHKAVDVFGRAYFDCYASNVPFTYEVRGLDIRKSENDIPYRSLSSSIRSRWNNFKKVVTHLEWD